MGEKMDITKKKCTTPKGRASFPHLFEAHAMKEDQEAKFTLTLLFPKNTDLKELKRAAKNAAIEKWGVDEKKWPKNMKWPFRDGDEKEDLEGYAGNIFVYASSKKRPGCVDNGLNPIMTDEQFYAGCYARATLIAFAYDVSGNKGVSFSLQNVQKLGEGKSFGGRRKAEDDFDSVEDQSEVDGSENEDNYDKSMGC
jgi:hypothetical protein